MNQPSLFPVKATAYGKIAAPLASPADPITSHEAGTRHTRSGRRQRHCEIVWALVLAMPGKTAHELWSETIAREQTELGSFHEVYRRLNDLRAAGRVRQGEQRACSVKGTRMVTWYPVGKTDSRAA